jgi:hypothetical protein
MAKIALQFWLKLHQLKLLFLFLLLLLLLLLFHEIDWHDVHGN